MTTDTLMTEAPQTTEGAAASTQATQGGATAAPADGQQSAAPEQTAAAPAQQQPADQTQVPESYEFKAPEGVELFEGDVETYSEIAKELKLTSEQAQTAFEKLAVKRQANQQAQVEKIKADWKQQTITDPEYGGEKLQENMAVVLKGFDTYGTRELMKLLIDSGLENHPEIIRLGYRVGKSLMPDSNLVTGRQTQAQALDARSHYPASNMNP